MVEFLVKNIFKITHKIIQNYILLRFNTSLFFKDPRFSNKIGCVKKINYSDETISFEKNGSLKVSLYNPNNISSFNTKTHFVIINNSSILSKIDILEMLKFNNQILFIDYLYFKYINFLLYYFIINYLIFNII